MGYFTGVTDPAESLDVNLPHELLGLSSCTLWILFICSLIKNDRNLIFQTCLNGVRRRWRTGAVPVASPEIEFQSGWNFKCFYGWNRKSHITHLKMITTASAICLKSNKGIRYAKNTMMSPILPRRQKMVKLWVTLGPLKLDQNQKTFWIFLIEPPKWCVVGCIYFFFEKSVFLVHPNIHTTQYTYSIVC